MDIELQHKYNAMVNHVVQDDPAQAQAVLSDILASKMAERLRSHNAQMMTLNRTAMDTAVVAVDNVPTE